MYRILLYLLIVAISLPLSAEDAYALKRVVVLYFEDHSGFDSATGCGCLPIGPLKFLFGRGGQHIRWDLATGFRDLTTQALAESPYYESVSFDELIVAMAEEDVSFRDLSKSGTKRTRLADKLNADALLIGDLRKFNQERLKGNASRNMLYRGDGATTVTGGVQAVGYYYRAAVEIDLKIYDALGKQLSLSKVTGSEVYQVGGVHLAPFQAVASNRGTEVSMGNAKLTEQIDRPIVSYGKLDKIQFGSADYRKTLFGIATEKAIENLIVTLQERIGPAPDSIPEAEPPAGITGKIAMVDGSEAYINLGSGQGIRKGQLLVIFATTPVFDPDTGEILGSVNQRVGKAEIVEVKTDRFSRIKILEGMDDIRKGHIVQVQQDSPNTSERTHEKLPRTDRGR